MRKLCAFICSLLLMPLFASSIQAQSGEPLAAANAVALQNNAICGAPLLREKEQAALHDLAQHPELLTQQNLQKTAWNFTVGSQKSWYADDFRTSQRYLAPSTCRAVGQNCYIFVEDAVWGDRVNQTAVDAFKKAFDSSTPANATKGIYQTDVGTFGTPPNVDSDNKIIIFILDIKDNYSNTGTGGFVGGYFTSGNQTPGAQSNLTEMIYIDADPVSLDIPTGLEFGLSTIAHEFQHLLHFNFDTNELTFINEGCSLVAEVICGYPIYAQDSYVTNANVSLLSWRSDISDYSRAARFFTYLHNQIGANLFKPLVQSTQDGTAGIDAALQAVNSSVRFDDILRNFVVANILDDKSLNPAFGYTYPNLPKAVGRLLANPNVPAKTSAVQNFGVEYLSFKYGANLKARFTVANPSILIKAVEIGPASKRVLEVAPNVDFVEPDYGGKYSEVHFVIVNTNPTFPFNYTYQASGISRPIELKWDQAEPLGAFQFTAHDTVCVAFDAILGGRLDSIRIAPRQAGTYTAGIWRFTGVQHPTPLGKRLAFPLTASLALTPQRPFPVPYPREYWNKIDLRALGISTDQPFAVAYIVGANGLSPQSTEGPYEPPFRQFTYLQNPSSGQPGWYFVVTSETTIGVYLIRAYVSFPTTGVRQTIELAPSTFFLAQNYPNPFNPSTTIEFSLPKAGYVTLKIFNALGEEIATLLHEKRAAGKHSVVWKAGNTPSGVYMYRLEGEGFVETRKLTLMK